MNAFMMKFRWLKLFSPAQSAGLTLACLVLAGCASTPRQQSPDATQQAQSQARVAAKIVIVSAEAKADFASAMSYIKTEEYDKATELLLKVSKAVPQSAIANINLAMIYKKQGKLKEAEECLKQALLAEPENPVANNEYAMLYRKTGRFGDARKLYEKILDIYPNFNMAHRNLGILCDLYLRDYECALQHYAIYSNAEQEDKTVKIWIADIQKRTGK